MCANQGQIDILGKIINGHNLRFLIQGSFTFEKQIFYNLSIKILTICSQVLSFSDQLGITEILNHNL